MKNSSLHHNNWSRRTSSLLRSATMMILLLISLTTLSAVLAETIDKQQQQQQQRQFPLPSKNTQKIQIDFNYYLSTMDNATATSSSSTSTVATTTIDEEDEEEREKERLRKKYNVQRNPVADIKNFPEKRYVSVICVFHLLLFLPWLLLLYLLLDMFFSFVLCDLSGREALINASFIYNIPEKMYVNSKMTNIHFLLSFHRIATMVRTITTSRKINCYSSLKIYRIYMGYTIHQLHRIIPLLETYISSPIGNTSITNITRTMGLSC